MVAKTFGYWWLGEQRAVLFAHNDMRESLNVVIFIHVTKQTLSFYQSVVLRFLPTNSSIMKVRQNSVKQMKMDDLCYW